MAEEYNKDPIAYDSRPQPLSDNQPMPLEKPTTFDIVPDKIPVSKWDEIVRQDEKFTQVGSTIVTTGGTTISNRSVTNITGGAKTATVVVGPSSNDDSDSYDYVTDGTNDNVQLQSAVDDLPTGGKIVLREGTYTLGGAVTVDNNDITFEGMGWKTIVKAKTDLYTPDDAMLYVSGSNILFRDIYFDGNSANQSDYGGIVTDTGLDNFYHRCYFKNAVGSSVTLDSANEDFHFTECVFNGWDKDNGGDLAINTANSSEAVAVNLCYFINTKTLGGFIGQTLIENAVILNSVFYANVSAYNSTIISTTNGVVAGNHIFTDGSCGASAVGIKGSDPGRIYGNNVDLGGSGNVASQCIQAGNAIVSGNWISGGGIGISTAGRLIKDNVITGTAAHCIKINSDRSIVSGNKITANALGADNTYSGIQFAINMDHCVVSGNVIDGNGATNDLKYCIEEQTGCDSNIITSNVATGADTAQISVVGGSTVNADNITA